MYISAYRAKLKDSEEFIHWDIFGQLVGIDDCKFAPIYDANGDSYWMMRDVMHLIDLETIGRYTGSKDIKGNMIFSGDILKVEVDRKKAGCRESSYWRVEYKEFCNFLGFRAYGKDRRFNCGLTRNVVINANAEIIGNIHDNPEILEAE